LFTGLIEDLGTLRELRRGAGEVRLTVTTALPMAELTMGESIAVNGICLTVVAFGNGTFSADVSNETVARTTLAELAPGQRVNLERALRLSDRLGGHLVSGHVDGVGTVVERLREGNAIRFTFRIPAQLSPYLVGKGSVAVDGISLTANEVSGETFSLTVIPHTLAMTTLHTLPVGGRVNIETDIIGKYVERFVRAGAAKEGGIDSQFLAKHGFL
jgi:riboflavin synthase